MRQVAGRRGRMSWDRCALGQASVLRSWSPEASSAFHLAGKVRDIPSYRTNRVCEESGDVLLALNNIHSPGDERPCRAMLITRCVQQVAEAVTWQFDEQKRVGLSCRFPLPSVFFCTARRSLALIVR